MTEHRGAAIANPYWSGLGLVAAAFVPLTAIAFTRSRRRDIA